MNSISKLIFKIPKIKNYLQLNKLINLETKYTSKCVELLLAIH